MSAACTAVVVLATASARAAPAISIVPPRIGFDGGHGFQRGGGIPGEQQRGLFQVENAGGTKLHVTDMAIVGDAAAAIAFDDPFCGTGRDCRRHFSLDPGERRLFSVTCTAPRPGVFSASLVVRSNARRTTVPMSCVGNHRPIIELSQSEFDFGVAVACNGLDPCDPNCVPTRPLLQTLTVSNKAPEPSELDFYIAPDIVRDEDDFTTAAQGSPDGPIVLAAGESYDFTVSFHPRDPGERGPGPLSLVSLFPGQAPISIPFHAEGGEGRLELDLPGELGPVMFGQTILSSITARNTGTTCLTIAGFSFTGDCDVSGPSGQITLLPGSSVMRDIACTPTVAFGGSARLRVEVRYLDPDVVQRLLNVIVTGGALVTGAALDFTRGDAVEIGRSATQRTSVQNRGLDALTLVLMTSTHPEFTATLPDASLPLALGVGDVVDVDVTFTPTAAPILVGGIAFDVTGGAGATLLVVGEGVPASSGPASQLRITASTDLGASPSHASGCSASRGAGASLFMAALWLARRRRKAAVPGEARGSPLTVRASR